MSSDTGGLPVYLLIIIILSVIKALCTASKRSLDSASRNRLREILDDDPDNKKVDSVMKLMERPSRYHYADLFIAYLNTIIGFVLFDIICRQEFVFRNRVIADIVFAVFLISFTDILPKKLAVQSVEKSAMSLSGFQWFIYYLTFPFVKVCVFLSNVILVIMRKDTHVDDTLFSEEEVMSMLDKGQESGDIKEEGRRMIDSIFEFDDLLAYEIMTPRTDVFMIDLRDDKEEYFDQLMDLTYSRIPVCDGDPDNIVGILHIKDYLLRASIDGFDNVKIEEIMREPYMVPETKNIDSLFVELQKTKQHIVILIDEYGGFSGLVSVEDIIEQIVGDIDDEFDEDDRIIEKVDDNTYIVDGNVYLDDLDEETGVSLESENSETIGGFIIDLMGEIPKEDLHYQPIEYENYSFQILEVKDRRIEKLKIVIHDEESSDEDDDQKK